MDGGKICGHDPTWIPTTTISFLRITLLQDTDRLTNLPQIVAISSEHGVVLEMLEWLSS
jgi:hypothetical protein